MTAIDDLFPEGEEILLLEPRERFDQCIVGVGRRFNHTFAIYSEPRVLAVLGEDATEDDDDPETSAREHFEYNIVGGWVGDGTPAFITPIEDAA